MLTDPSGGCSVAQPRPLRPGEQNCLTHCLGDNIGAREPEEGETWLQFMDRNGYTCQDADLKGKDFDDKCECPCGKKMVVLIYRDETMGLSKSKEEPQWFGQTEEVSVHTKRRTHIVYVGRSEIDGMPHYRESYVDVHCVRCDRKTPDIQNQKYKCEGKWSEIPGNAKSARAYDGNRPWDRGYPTDAEASAKCCCEKEKKK